MSRSNKPAAREVADYRKARLAEQMALKEKKEEAKHGKTRNPKQWDIDEEDDDDFRMFPEDDQGEEQKSNGKMKF